LIDTLLSVHIGHIGSLKNLLCSDKFKRNGNLTERARIAFSKLTLLPDLTQNRIVFNAGVY